MWKDKIVEEIRKTREHILLEVDYDIQKIINEIREMQDNDRDKVVSFVKDTTPEYITESKE